MWWAGQRPGLLSPDSVRYVIHVTSGPWTGDHSVLYDFFVLISLKLVNSVWLVTLAQTVLYAALLGYTAGSVRAMGVPSRWAGMPALVLPVVPTFGAFVATLWKDVAFAAAELFLVATILRLLARRRRSTVESSWPLLASLMVGLLGLVLFRNNGFLMVPIVAGLLAVALTGLRRQMLTLGVAAIVAFYLASDVVYPAAHIKPANSSLTFGIFYSDIAAVYRSSPGSFTAADKRLMMAEASLAHWRHAARNCYTSDPLFTPGFDRTTADQNHVALGKLWLRVARRKPLVVLRTRLCRSAIAWNPLPPPGSPAQFAVLVITVPKTLYHPFEPQVPPPNVRSHLHPHPVSYRLASLLRKAREVVKLRAVSWLFARGATWCYVAYLVLAVAAYRLRRRDILAAGTVSLANQLVVLAANPAQLYRYMVGPIFIGVMLLPLLAARAPLPDAEPAAIADDGLPEATPTHI